MKRFFILMCIFSLLASTLSVFAEENNTQTAVGEVLGEKYKLLAALDILEDEDFQKPAAESVTRAEAAVVLLKLLNTSPDENIENAYFRDVSAGSIEETAIYSAVNKGIMKAVRDNYFYPSYPITKNDIATAMFLSLGYSRVYGEERVFEICSKNDLFKDTHSNDELTREDFYITVYNALFMNVITYNGTEFKNDDDLLSNIYKVSVKRGVVTAAGGIELDKKATFSKNIVKIDGEMFSSDIDLYAEDYLGRNVKCYYKNDEDGRIVFIENDKNNIVSFDSTDNLEYGDLTYTANEGRKNKSYKLTEP